MTWMTDFCLVLEKAGEKQKHDAETKKKKKLDT